MKRLRYRAIQQDVKDIYGNGERTVDETRRVSSNVSSAKMLAIFVL